MSTMTEAVTAAVSSVVLLAVASGCGGPAEAWLTVRLAAAERGPHRSDAVGDTVAVVALDGEPRTLVARRLPAEALDVLRDSSSDAMPVTVELRVPASPPDWSRRELDIVLFLDADGDGELGPREPWISAWHGGRGGYRLRFHAEAGRWTLIEGGSPPVEHEVGAVTVTLDPYIPTAIGRAAPGEPAQEDDR